MLAAACQMFLGKEDQQVGQIALETLEGHQRAIMGNMTVEEIYKDRKKFSHEVFRVASSDLVNMGISVVSYTLKDVRDDLDYLRSLGKARTAQVQKDARIGEAEASRDAGIRESIAKQEKVAAQFHNEIEVAKAERDFQLKSAVYDTEVNSKKAQADLAYQLQVAKTKQRIEEERMEVAVVERRQQISVQEQETTRMEREIEATVRKPAEAERFRLEKIAEAERARLIMEAEAESEAIKLKGDAKAYAAAACAAAEAEQMSQKAKSFKEYKEAAMVDLLLQALPKIAEEASRPLSDTKKVTMISSGGEVGASRLAGEILDIVEKVPAVVSKLTGVNIGQAQYMSSG
uniref:Flotillin n=1 Tax=Eptatretus burgeri TaxID=7764 RepID=A0A8C4N6Z6_EPTBU